MRSVLARLALPGLALAAAMLPALLAAQMPDARARRIVDSAQFRRASALIRADHERFVRELITLTEIPAPPFKEERRARAFLEALRALKLTDVEMDEEGNVMAMRKGSGRSILAVVAHLDTVFPDGTDVRVRRQGTRLSAPGIADDARGLAVTLAVIRAMNAAGFRTTSDILFVGSVGEEGAGDLRGVKFLLQKGRYRGRITSFLAIDETDQRVVTRRGVGSRRYRVAFRGPGGHSYGAFGLVNPAYAMARAVARLSELQVPVSPRTTYNVGAVRGGTSVNSIPSEMTIEVDIRSESCTQLGKVNEAFLRIVRTAVADENALRSTRDGTVEAETHVIGDRPCGETPIGSPIVQGAAGALRAFGLSPSYTSSSTDSNVAMSMGIPALTIGAGSGGRAHSLDEWTDVEPAGVAQSVEVALAVVLASAGVEPASRPPRPAAR